MMSKQRKWGVHNCPNGLYYLRDVTDHSVYVHKDYGYLYSPYKEDIELVSSLLNELADKVDEQQATIDELDQENADLLGARIRAQEEWEKCTDKLKAKILEQQVTISALKDIFKNIVSYSKWDSEKPYCSLGIAVDRKTYYKIREILNE